MSKNTMIEVNAIAAYLKTLSEAMSIDDCEISPKVHAKAMKAYKAASILEKAMKK